MGEKNKMKSAMKIIAVFALAFLFPSFSFAQYTRTDLVTNLGTGGTVEDAHLVNAWGSGFYYDKPLLGQ